MIPPRVILTLAVIFGIIVMLGEVVYWGIETVGWR